jgi:signal transduction histidine kinase
LARSSAPDPPSGLGTIDRIGAVFRLLFQVRMLLTATTLLVLPNGQLTVTSLIMIAGLSLLYWLAARYWRRILPRLFKHPILTGVDVFIAFGVLSLQGPLGTFFLSTVVASAIGGLLFRVRGIVLLSAAQIACYLAAIGYYVTLHHLDPGSLVTFQTMIGQPAYYPIVGMCGYLLRRMFDQQEAIDAARIHAETDSAAADERARLAREMHDSLAKTLRGIAMSAKALPLWVRKSPERATTEAERIATAAEVASREARELIADLREDQTVRSLDATVRDVAERWSTESGCDVTLDLSASAELPLMARYELTAIVKEALTNVERHAGAGRVEIRLTPIPRGLEMAIHDDGAGFGHAIEGDDWLDVLARDGHYGVVGMYERAKRAGAELTLASVPGQGTTITVSFASDAPAKADAHAPDDRQPAEAG